MKLFLVVFHHTNCITQLLSSASSPPMLRMWQVSRVRVPRLLWCSTRWRRLGKHSILPQMPRYCTYACTQVFYNFAETYFSLYLLRYRFHIFHCIFFQNKSYSKETVCAARFPYNVRSHDRTPFVYGIICCCLHRNFTLCRFRQGRLGPRCALVFFRLHG